MPYPNLPEKSRLQNQLLNRSRKQSKYFNFEKRIKNPLCFEKGELIQFFKDVKRVPGVFSCLLGLGIPAEAVV